MARSARWKPTRCRRCTANTAAGDEISSRGLCKPCAIKAVTNANVQMAEKRGPAHERWVQSMQRAAAEAAQSIDA